MNDLLVPFSSTGPQSGLQLVLNIEQYDYVQGISQDAGIKVHILK